MTIPLIESSRDGPAMTITKEQLEVVHEIAAHCTGQCLSNPTDELEKAIVSWPKEAREEARTILDDNVFYCENCGWYCDADERHAGDLCDDCHDEREDGEDD